MKAQMEATDQGWRCFVNDPPIEGMGATVALAMKNFAENYKKYQNEAKSNVDSETSIKLNQREKEALLVILKAVEEGKFDDILKDEVVVVEPPKDKDPKGDW